MKKQNLLVEIQHKKDGLYANWIKVANHIWPANNVGGKEIKTIAVDISDANTHSGILVDILKQLEKVWWASYEETKEEWCTLLMCDRDDPNFLKRVSKFTKE